MQKKRDGFSTFFSIDDLLNIFIMFSLILKASITLIFKPNSIIIHVIKN